MLRNAALGLSIAIVFALVVVMMANVMPAPLRQIDYMVIGSVATLVSMSVLFLALLATSLKAKDVFFKKRPKK